MNSFVFEWPQIVVILGTILKLVACFYKAGKAKDRDQSLSGIVAFFIVEPLIILVLYYGGFFTEVRP